ncbi:tRNA 5-methylaminomethyl-2-thiouridine biosynthesis bifunctional protein MnmC [Pseudoruegeria aquimaris]|uniref:tRNA 5-methylaminomethyl-2-thiouridine biosynthesis bifunctional protein MnmC n=1 Tax=Pseudoruegeria aquimaris TaxID=393663 RepID=A0A1Y5T8S5_9RHOB|nr:tRNA (5-methylaminomethyl-2-thiouridine)(34)-methyltransferase MnmD [Pseudoruegeria aquimaris]SLN56362.1 tRNA 5-methylaminomethyl-2-thiouridine biosynthesis bifunctional protein MnmC [Pseudoruegeria aquimaris]
MPRSQTANLEWRDGALPVSRRFEDPYFSLENGLAETRHVFLAGNGLPARFRPGFHIAELGFGTGLNLFAALLCWRESGQQGPLAFTSFEAYPMRAEEMARALAAFPEARAIADPFLEQWEAGARRITLPDLTADIRIGDARRELANWEGKADAWFLDGFAPARNPELWEEALMAEVARHTAPGGSAATYTAAGFVRRGLEAAGFTVERTPGYGRKRHMTRATLTGAPTPP